MESYHSHVNTVTKQGQHQTLLMAAPLPPTVLRTETERVTTNKLSFELIFRNCGGLSRIKANMTDP